MKNSFTKLQNGFTLIEIVISITISTIILTGVMMLLLKIQTDIITSKQSTNVYTDLTEFTATMRNFSELYESGSIIVSGSGAYNVALLMRPDNTSGVLVGVVKKSTPWSLSRLDQSKDTYGEKIIAYRKLTSSGQVNAILADTGSIYNVDFFDDWVFKNLLASNFSITPYNSGTIFEYSIDIEAPYHPSLEGASRKFFDSSLVNTFSFTLDF